MNNYLNLCTHPLFRNFKEESLLTLSMRFKEYSCDEGAVIYYEKDRANSLYIFLEGEFCASSSDSVKKNYYLEGDFTNPESLLGLRFHDDTLICRSPGRDLKLERENFVQFVSALSKKEREFKILYDDNNRYISGFDLNMNQSKELKPEKIIKYHWRRSSFFLFEKIFYPFIFLLVLVSLSSSTFSFPYDTIVYKTISGGIVLYAIIRLILWLSEKFVLTEKNISAVKINFRPLGIKRNLLPLDQVRGIRIEKNRLKNRFFNVGSILIQTSAGTVLKLSDMDKPKKVQKVITDFINHSVKQSEGKERVEIRKKMENYFESKETIHSSEKEISEVKTESDTIFNKSVFYLFSSTWWQLAAIAGLIVLAYLFRDSRGALFTLPAIPFFFILLWRIQDWRNDLYKVSQGKIIDINKKPFGKSESNNLADIGFVTNVRSERKGILQYLFNYGDVLIETAGGNICFETVAAPLVVQAKLLELREQWKERENKKKRERQFQDFLVYSEIYKQAEEQNRIGRLTPPLAEDYLPGVENR
ncbi:MAG: hypothetical protein PF518_13760 [Spirochaetaceae bacterium]|jgi:uncharacterized membrane protein YdbT with pleckstrin-like domain|nr:hypothetical protein [Spirochaetaceae bacterium]